MLKTKVQPTSLYFPIDQIERRDDGYFVTGYAFVNEVVEGEGGVRIKRSAMEAATPEYMRYANIREMHQPIASGVATSALWEERGCKLEIKVVDPIAQRKCEEKVYKGLSVRVRPTVMRGKDVESLDWFETSLVDRPKDPDAVFTCFRVDGASEEGEAELLPDIQEIDGKFILRLEDDTFALFTTRELAEAEFITRGQASSAVPNRENLEGKPKNLVSEGGGPHACPQCGAVMTCRSCGYGRTAAPDPTLLPTIERVIKEEAGKFSVYSHDGEKKLGGPYDTRDEAEKRLREVEYFKNKERVSGGPEALPAVLTDIFRLEDDHTIVLQRLTEVENDLVRVRGEQEAANAALAAREKSLSEAKERIVTLENTPATVPPILDTEGYRAQGTHERRFAANDTGERREVRVYREKLLARRAELIPMRPTDPAEQSQVATEIMRIDGELQLLAFG